MVDFTVNPNSSVYYSGTYWDEYPLVRETIFRRVSGEPTLGPQEQFARTTQRTFNRALILNCGNGWVERGMQARGLFREAIGIEYSESLLEEARSAAENVGLRAEYRQMDVNTADFPFEGVDLVVNQAAAHHIAYLDRVFRALCRLLPVDGWFFGYDYVGPHRNQYSGEAWEAAWQTNLLLPETLRQELIYPHLPTMLVTDPTEAIHSELILEVFRRYFKVEEFIPLGGAVAYPLLTHNDRMWNASEAERSEWIARIIETDTEFLSRHPDSTLFAYFTGRPRKEVLDDEEQLERWTAEEVEREARASAAGGEYYPRSALASTSIAAIESAIYVEHRGTTIEELTHRINDLEAQLESLLHSTSYRVGTRLAQSKLGSLYRRARSSQRR
jgi:SAM-dependent methyltransferase